MKKLIILSLLSLSFGVLQAQPHLGIGGQGRPIYDHTSIVNLNDSDSYYVWLKNKSSVPFGGWVYMYTAVDTGNSVFNIIHIDSLNIFALNPGDSLPIPLTEPDYSPPNYRMGGNIVVIWPSASGCITDDSTAYTPLFILGSSSVIGITDDRSLKIFPNPSIGDVSVIGVGPTMVTTIRLLDERGALLKEFKNTSMLSLAEYPAGNYFIQVEFADKTTCGYKIVRIE
jgi:hypothetical protein